MKATLLRTRLFLSLLPFVAILLAMGIYAIVVFSRLASGMEQAVSHNYASIMAVQDMSRTLAEMDRKMWQRNATNEAFAELKQKFEANLARHLENATLPEEIQLNRQLTADFSSFLQATGRFNRLRSPKDVQPDPQAMESRLSQMAALLEKIRELNYQAVLDTSREIQKTTRDGTRLMILGFVVVLGVSGYACFQVGRSILRPIRLLTEATRELGEGRLDHVVPFNSRDELGQLAGAFNQMAAQLREFRKNTSEEIVRLHRTMEATLASFPDPIFVLTNNQEGGIELKNPAASQLAASLHLEDRLPDPLQATVREALASGENFLPHSFDETVSYRVNGSEKFFLPRVLAMRDKDNALFGVAVVLHDVTRFRLLDSAKTDLVATVSHELKTPLTSLRMALHILLERTVGGLTPKQDELLQTARDDAEHLLDILNDLLDLARLQEGDAGLHLETVSPDELLQAMVGAAADSISSRGFKMKCVIEPGLPPVVVDRQRIGYVFDNFITNAVKHSPPGGKIVARAARAEADGVLFSVTDLGPGIAEEYHARIFDRFFRVPGQAKSGAGLGLSIAREIAMAHGGRIGVRSSPGQGSTFFVVLKAAV